MLVISLGRSMEKTMVSVLSTALGLRPQAHFGPTRIFQPVNSIYLYLVSAAGDVTLLAGCFSKVVDPFGSVKTIRLSKSCYFRILQEKRKISLICNVSYLVGMFCF